MSVRSNSRSPAQAAPTEVAGSAGLGLAEHWKRRDDVPEDIRQRLSDAVFKAFVKDDYNKVGIRELSRLSGLSSATIYKYYESKEVLLTTMWGERFPLRAEEMGKSVSPDKSARENFQALFSVLLGLYDRNPAIPIVFFITVPARLWMQSGGWRAKEVVPIFTAVVQAGQRKGELDPALTVSTAIGLFYMYIQREVQMWYLGGKTWKMADRIDSFFKYFWRSVQSQASSSLEAGQRVGKSRGKRCIDCPGAAKSRSSGTGSSGGIRTSETVKHDDHGDAG